MQIYDRDMYVYICSCALSIMNTPKSGCEPLLKLIQIQVQPLIGLEVHTYQKSPSDKI